MRRPSWITASALLGLACVSAVEGQIWRGEEVVGVEVRDERRKPLENAEVTFRFADVEPYVGPRPELTDDRGRAIFPGLVLGRWRIDVSREGYAHFFALVEVREGKPPVVTAGPLREGTDATLSFKFFKVSGRDMPAATRPQLRQEGQQEGAPVTAPSQGPAPAPPVATEPEATKPAARKPAAQEPAAEKPAASRMPEATEPEGTQPAPEPAPPAKPNVKPDATPAPEAAKPQPMLPAPQPARPQPARPQPEDAEPETPQPALPEVQPRPSEPRPEVPAPSRPEAQPRPSEPRVTTPAPTPTPEAAPTPMPKPPAVMSEPPAVRPLAPPFDPATARADLRPAAGLRSGGSCPDCPPGENALTAEQMAAPVTSGGDCSAAQESLRQIVALAGGRGGLAAEGWAGPLIDPATGVANRGVHSEAQQLVTGLLAPLADPSSSCQVIAVFLPAGSRFRGYRYEARHERDQAGCVAGQDCGTLGALWPTHPAVDKTPSGTLVWARFENRSERAQVGRMVVFFEPAGQRRK